MGLKDALTPKARERARKLSGDGDEEKNLGAHKLPPFPIDELPWPHHELLELIAPTTEAPIEGLVLAIFSALAAALGRKVAFPTIPLLYPMIWGLVLAPPYFYRKGSVLHWAVTIARALIPNLKTMNGLGSIERVNIMLSKEEGVKLFLRVAELGGTITKAQRSGTSNLIFDACDLYDHIDGWDLGTNQSKPCYGYEATLLGLSTLKGIKPIFREVYTAGGFLRRLAIVQATEREAIANQPPVDQTRLDQIIEKIRQRLSVYNGTTRLISLDGEARAHYADWYMPWRADCLKLPDQQMEVVGGTEAMIRKLALQPAALENKPQISEEIIAWAIRWGERFQAHSVAVASQLALAGIREVEERIRALLQKQPLRSWEIQQRINNPPPATRLRQILDGMVSMGMLDHWTIPGREKGAGEWFGLPGSKPKR